MPFSARLLVFIALLLCAQGISAAAPPPGPSGPITITRGGVYTGTWVSTSTTPAVRISTTEPVTLRDSVVENLAGGTLIQSDFGLATNIVLERVTGRGGTGRFFKGEAIKSLTVRNCTLSKTGGIYVLRAQPGATISITRNRAANIQHGDVLQQFVQFNEVETAAIDVSWNEVVNRFGDSRVEDNINLYRSANARIHDNYIQGGYPTSAGGGYSGSGIMMDSGAHDNEVWNNQIVDTTNAGIGIASGWNNKVHDNRLVFDGKLDDGTKLAAANVGVYVWNYDGNPGWSNNAAWNNTVGWVNAAGNRNDWWLPGCSRACKNARVRGAVGRARERAEYRAWLRKLTRSGITIGSGSAYPDGVQAGR